MQLKRTSIKKNLVPPLSLKAQIFIATTSLFILLAGCAGKRQQTIVEDSPQKQQSSPNWNSSGHKNHQPLLGNSKPIYICEDITQFVDKSIGNGECVDLLKACANTPNTPQWREGESVWGNSIPTGTAIATFEGSKYPNKTGYHAAIYVSQDEKGIYVWDQWRGKNVHLRLIRFDDVKKKPGNDAARYSVITQ